MSPLVRFLRVDHPNTWVAPTVYLTVASGVRATALRCDGSSFNGPPSTLTRSHELKHPKAPSERIAPLGVSSHPLGVLRLVSGHEDCNVVDTAAVQLPRLGICKRGFFVTSVNAKKGIDTMFTFVLNGDRRTTQHERERHRQGSPGRAGASTARRTTVGKTLCNLRSSSIAARSRLQSIDRLRWQERHVKGLENE